MERSIPYALLDNIIGFDDDHITPGEKLKKAVGEDPLGVATTVVKGVGKAAKSAFDRVLEEGPLDALTGSLNDYSRDLVGAGTRLKSGTQGYIDSGMTQAEARDKQISDALRLSELIPLMGSAATGFRAGRVALPEAPFDSSRRSFLGGIAALPAVAAIAPDVFSDALKSVGPKVARTTSSLDVSVAKIKDLLKQKDLLEQQSDTLRMDPSFDNRNALSQESVKKDRESFQVQDEIEQTARRALDDLNPTDLSNAADDSIEMIAEQFSTSGVLQYDMDSPAFDKLMEQVKLRGMHTAKDSNGIDQFPYARDIYEDYYNPIRNDTGGFSSSVFKAPQNLNMVESRPVAPDIVEKMKDLEISNFQQQIGLQETEMIAKGASASEIDAMKEGFRQKIFKLQNGNREDFSEDFFADGGAVMQGVGSLNETARNMSRGPRGIAGYQQFADGGPVYMSKGGGSGEESVRDTILSTIYGIESNNDYNAWNNRAKNPPSQALTSLTVKEIMDYQGNENGPAAGAGQIKYNTLKYLLNTGTLSEDDLFTESVQDAANNKLLDRRGFNSWLNGEIDNLTFGSNIASEWASIPLLFDQTVNGKAKERGDSRYGGSNEALIGADAWENVLYSARASLAPVPAPEEIMLAEAYSPQTLVSEVMAGEPTYMTDVTAGSPEYSGMRPLDRSEYPKEENAFTMFVPEEEENAFTMFVPEEEKEPEALKAGLSLYEKYAPSAVQDALLGIGYLNSVTGPSR